MKILFSVQTGEVCIGDKTIANGEFLISSIFNVLDPDHKNGYYAMMQLHHIELIEEGNHINLKYVKEKYPEFFI